MKTVLKHTRRLIILVVGITVLVIGILMLVLPGPGLLVLIIGLAILASEFVWAQQLLEQARGKAQHHYRRLPFVKHDASTRAASKPKQTDSA